MKEFFHWLWYEVWGYDIYMFYFTLALLGYYIIKWVYNGMPPLFRKEEENDNVKRNFWDYM